MTEVKKPEEQQAPKAPELLKREFRPLLPGEKIDRCSYILPNRLQCWKAGEEEVKEILTDKSQRSYQLCERHTRIQKALDAGSLKSEDINTPLKEMTLEPPPVPADFEVAKTQEEPPKVEASKGEKEAPKETVTYHYRAEEKK